MDAPDEPNPHVLPFLAAAPGLPSDLFVPSVLGCDGAGQGVAVRVGRTLDEEGVVLYSEGQVWSERDGVS